MCGAEPQSRPELAPGDEPSRMFCSLPLPPDQTPSNLCHVVSRAARTSFPRSTSQPPSSSGLPCFPIKSLSFCTSGAEPKDSGVSPSSPGQPVPSSQWKQTPQCSQQGCCTGNLWDPLYSVPQIVEGRVAMEGAHVGLGLGCVSPWVMFSPGTPWGLCGSRTHLPHAGQRSQGQERRAHAAQSVTHSHL